MTRPARAAWLLLLLAGCLRPAERPESVALLTGFEAFGGRAANASWDAIAALDGARLDGVLIRCVRLPVVWGGTADPLRRALDRWRPDYVLCLGEGRPGRYSVETAAVNRVAAHPDNRGALPGREAVIPGGPAGYPTALPADAVVDALAKAGYPVERSLDAGRFLCEECFYTILHLGRERRMSAPHGFLHVPPYPEGAVGAPAHAESVRRAVLAALQAMRGPTR